MDKAARYGALVEEILREYGSYKPAVGDIEIEKIFVPEAGHYQLITVGWNGQHRVHGCTLHVDIKGDKIWIQHDGTEEGIANTAGRGRSAQGGHRAGLPFTVQASVHGFRRELTAPSGGALRREAADLARILQLPPIHREGQPWPDD